MNNNGKNMQRSVTNDPKMDFFFELLTIVNILKCNLCHSQPPLIRVPLAFPLSLLQILKEL